MKVSRFITGTVQDTNWKFTFDQAKLNDWTLGEIPVHERIHKILPRLHGSENVCFDDGTPITFEELKSGEAPIIIYVAMLAAWNDAVSGGIQAEAEAKNESTSPSPDSSTTDSTSAA